MKHFQLPQSGHIHGVSLSLVIALVTLCVILISTQPALANNSTYTFASEAEEQQFRELINELRCPKCQNQTIAESDAPLALDLRERVYQMTREGHTRSEIIDFMRTRYGDFVHYKPPFNASTVILWAGPGLVLLIGIATIIGITRRQRRQVALSDQEQARLGALLAEDGGSESTNDTSSDAKERRE